MSVSSFSNVISQAFCVVQENRPTLASPSQIVRNVQKLALPAIALVAAINIAGANADPCTACMTACDRIEFAPFTLACYAFCVFGPACR